MDKIKVIFLNIDGVLNRTRTKAKSPSGFIGIESGKVRLLKSIVCATQAKIVLTGAWRYEWTPNVPDALLSADGAYMQKKLRQGGLSIYDKLAHYPLEEEPRGQLIYDWLEDYRDAGYDIDHWIVIDSEKCEDYDQLGIPYIRTSFFVDGLTQENVDQAIRLLN